MAFVDNFSFPSQNLMSSLYIIKLEYIQIALVSESCHNKVSQNERLKRTELSCLTVLEARNSKSSCHQGNVPFETCTVTSFLTFSEVQILCLQSLVFPGLQRHVPIFRLHMHSPCVFTSSSFIMCLCLCKINVYFLEGHQSYGIRAHPNDFISI